MKERSTTEMTEYDAYDCFINGPTGLRPVPQCRPSHERMAVNVILLNVVAIVVVHRRELVQHDAERERPADLEDGTKSSDAYRVLRVKKERCDGSDTGEARELVNGRNLRN